MNEKLKVREFRVLEQPLIQNGLERITKEYQDSVEVEVDFSLETEDQFNYLSGKVRVCVSDAEKTSLAGIRNLTVEKLKEIIK